MNNPFGTHTVAWRVNLDLPPPVYDKVCEFAERAGKSMAEAILCFVDDGLDQHYGTDWRHRKGGDDDAEKAV